MGAGGFFRKKDLWIKNKSMKLEFQTMPLSPNSMYAHVGRRRFLTKQAKENKQALSWEARSQYRGKPLKGDVAVEISFIWPDKRRRDADNIKGLLDALTGIIWEDDSQINDLHILKVVEKGKKALSMHVWSTET